jgi:energy-coupling factor transporter ATP-binding protein EcfA2
MLTELQITRFKSVREETLNLGKVNLFIGGNGSGKSNLLEAIGLASACLSRGLSDSDIARKGLRLTPPELMKSSFKNEELPKTLALSASFSGSVEYKSVLQSREGDPLLRFFSESAQASSKRVFGRSNRGASATGVPHADRLEQHRGLWDQIKATYDIDSHVDHEFQQFSRYVIYTPQTDFLRGRQSGRIDTPPIGLHGEGLPEAVTSYLDIWRNYQTTAMEKTNPAEKQIIDSCIDLVWLPGWAHKFGTHYAKPTLTSRDIADRSSQIVYFVDQFMHATRNRLSVYDSSEGTLLLLFAAIILSHPDAPKTFALDNVDNALNPRLTRRLVEQIIRVCSTSTAVGSGLGAKQVFLTSHNPTALDAFDLFDDDNRVFVVRRSERGHTTAQRLVPPKGMTKDQWEVVKAGRNLSQLWLDGDIPGALGTL